MCPQTFGGRAQKQLLVSALVTGDAGGLFSGVCYMYRMWCWRHNLQHLCNDLTGRLTAFCELSRPLLDGLAWNLVRTWTLTRWRIVMIFGPASRKQAFLSFIFPKGWILVCWTSIEGRVKKKSCTCRHVSNSIDDHVFWCVFWWKEFHKVQKNILFVF